VLLVPTLLMTLDPVRLGIVLLLITGLRPLPNLFAYWLGAMTASTPYMLVPLTVLHLVPSLRSFTDHYANPATLNNPFLGRMQIGAGVVALSIAALMAFRFRARQRACLLTADTTASILVPGSDRPNAISRPQNRAQDVATNDGSAKRGLRARIHYGWQAGATWPAFTLGALSGPPPVTTLLVLTTIMASGAAFGTQVSLALVWVVGMFAVVEIILVCHLAAPAKTQAALQLLHDWILAHRRQVLIALIAVAGVAMLALGMRGIRAGG
jgi:Sap, sulfolipid-1-addressing protein